jgi:hypothetical protein
VRRLDPGSDGSSAVAFAVMPTRDLLANALTGGVGAVVGAALGSFATLRSGWVVARTSSAAAELSYETAERQRSQQLQLAREERWAARQVDLYLRLIDVASEMEDFRMGNHPGKGQVQGRVRRLGRR